MKQFKVWIAIALLVASISVLVNMLFNPRPIQVVLETGQAVMTQNADYFTINTVMIFIICASIIGAAITFLFYNSEEKIFKPAPNNVGNINYDMIIPLLRDDERKAVRIILNNKGEILQNDLVLKLGLSKVKTTRILSSLEKKQVITKQRHGLTNHIKLKK